MDFNFLETYQDYTTTDLLKIIHQPELYQPAAVEAAKQILAGRQVSEEEEATVNDYLFEKEMANGQIIAEKTSYGTTGFLGWARNPANIMPAKWLNYLLFLGVLQYVWILYLSVKYVVLLNGCWECMLHWNNLLAVIYLLYIPIVFYLLYNKERWGWILLFVDNVFSDIILLPAMLQALIYADSTGATAILVSVAPVLIRTALAIFLWFPVVCGFFDVPQPAKNRTLVVGLALGLCFISLAFL